jgi:SAM-dependent methyltransferase
MHTITNDTKPIPKNAMQMICDQHVDKLSFDDKEILEFLDWKSLVNFSLVNKSWSKRLSKLINYRNPEIEKFIDLRLFTNVQKCMSANLKHAMYVNKAVELAQSFYETKPRGIKDEKYGAAFAMTPELLHYAMFLAKDETVLEIAGAGGENAAFLAFSGAKRVYMNDILSGEVQRFKDLCDQLPDQVQKKLEPILGNCFDLLQLKPELKGSVGLLLCNNLLHFFNDKEEEKFLELLKLLLKPGGRSIFTVNACYAATDGEDIYERYPENTAWQNIICLEHDYLQGTMPINSLYQSSLISTPSKVSVNYQQYYLWLKDKTTNYKWVEDKTGYKALPPEVAQKLEIVVSQNLNKFKNLYTGSLRLVTCIIRHFREKSLASLFKRAGFEVEQTFLIHGNGHLFFGKKPYGKATKIGIVIKAPNQVHTEQAVAS